MTINEASRRYNIPVKILREYESWGLCGEVKKVMGSWRYDDSDIERLSIIMTLHDTGFSRCILGVHRIGREKSVFIRTVRLSGRIAG